MNFACLVLEAIWASPEFLGIVTGAPDGTLKYLVDLEDARKEENHLSFQIYFVFRLMMLRC